MKPTERQKELYKKLAPIIGIEPKVIKYGDDTGENAIFIMECPDPTDNDVIFYSTIGLSDYSVGDRKYELMIAGYSADNKTGNILSTSAFFCIKDNWKVSHGTVFETLVEMYYKDSEMKHIFFTSPYLWEDKLEDFEVQNENIFFLLGIAISDAELEFQKKNGSEALEDLFEEKEIDIFDVNRKSIL
ncbi:suppressor of fused domain protein [Chryseobacterium vrystaatense]|uniref:Suppressor of fused-like domain-containing protein n=1 Tax=Chryseobacterium vrystaatense TaxID=307480 RepID=A0ABR4UND6_9FLAO|nr:suppressor of fused domain protein [Chryseobacterium vrystaatense]KFF26516.1 hypothetical protein IW16_11735 [Chryseobacterium vrystaatense]